MELEGHVFPQFFIALGASAFPLTGDTYKVGLSNSSTPVTLATSGVSTAKLWSDWKTNVAAEISGTGYTSGGATVSSPTLTAGGTDDSVATWTSGSNPSWTSATFTAAQAVYYDSSADGDYQLICFWDFGAQIPVTGSTFTLEISGSGLLTATVS